MTESKVISRRSMLIGGGAGMAAVLAGCRSGPDRAARALPAPTTTTPPVPHRRPSPNPYLSGNFAPLDVELTQRRLPVEGHIPSELRGTLLRNVPNAIDPVPADYHWFIGDGMLHGIELHDGGARYRNRYVRTDIAAELLHERPIPSQPADINPATNRAQTSIVSHAGRILALYEACLPTEITTDVETLGKYDFGGRLQSPMTAHPKVDPVTGEMFFFGLDPFSPPYLRYHVVDPQGNLVQSREITIPNAVMMHDFAITERNVVFFDLPVVYDLSLIGQRPFLALWRPENGARVGVMPRDGRRAPRWIDIDPCYVFHTVNAYDDGDAVVLDVVRHEQMFTDDIYGPSDGTGTLDRWTIDAGAGRVGQERIDERTQEFPKVDPRVVGRRHRYAYTVTTQLGDFVEPFGTLLQHDLVGGTAVAAALGPGRQPGEGVFVPAGGSAAEDEGWVLSIVYDAIRDGSDLVILDTTDFGGDPVATIALPQRVPFGFHGIWEPAA